VTQIDQMMSITTSGTSVSIVYDGFRNRVAKTVSGVTTQYLVESDLNPTGYPQVFDELNSSAVVTRTYTYGLQRIDEDQVTSNVWTPSFYGYDGAGNVRQLTNSTGTVTDSYEYDAYGNSFTVSGTTPNEFMYRGEQYDSDLGLYYLRARYYNPLTGRFMSKDPEHGFAKLTATLHKYLYANGDPVNEIDPRGREGFLDYAIKTLGSEKAVPFINAVGCGIGIWNSIAVGTIEDFKDAGNDLTLFGCVSIFFGANGWTAVGLDTLGFVACAVGFNGTLEAEDAYFKDRTEENLQKFNADLIGTLSGCAITGIVSGADLLEVLPE
jgi:RHS repeat-associated protein